MAKHKLTSEDMQALFDLGRNWGKIVSRQAFGEEGPGLDVDLAAMEDVADAVMRGVAAGTLEVATSQQAQRLRDTQPCPDCGLSVPIVRDTRPVTARTGPFEHVEPKGHCPVCRRDFFPPATAFEAGQPRV
jgi:hypothetical protein